MGICKSKISSTSSFENNITKKTSKNENSIINKSNSNQKIYLLLSLKNKETNYDNPLEFDNIEDCHTYLIDLYNNKDVYEKISAVRAFNNKDLVHEGVVLNGDKSGFECYITKKDFNSRDIIVNHPSKTKTNPNQKNYLVTILKNNKQNNPLKFDNVKDCHTYLFQLYNSKEFKDIRTILAYNNESLDHNNVVIDGDSSGFECYITNKKFTIQDILTIYKPPQNKKFKINGNEIQCEINNEFVFSLKRPYTENNFDFVGEQQLMVLNCTKQAAKDGILYEDFTFIEKLDENKYLFNSNGNEFKFYLNKQELEEFKSMCWKSEAEMLAYYDLK